MEKLIPKIGLYLCDPGGKIGEGGVCRREQRHGTAAVKRVGEVGGGERCVQRAELRRVGDHLADRRERRHAPRRRSTSFGSRRRGHRP